MAMIFSGSDDYTGPFSMFYAVKGEQRIRLEIYRNDPEQVVKMYQSTGYTVTTARETPQDVSNKFNELHSFKNWPR